MVMTSRVVLACVVPAAAVAIVTLVIWTRRRKSRDKADDKDDDVTSGEKITEGKQTDPSSTAGRCVPQSREQDATQVSTKSAVKPQASVQEKSSHKSIHKKEMPGAVVASNERKSNAKSAGGDASSGEDLIKQAMAFSEITMSGDDVILREEALVAESTMSQASIAPSSNKWTNNSSSSNTSSKDSSVSQTKQSKPSDKENRSNNISSNNNQKISSTKKADSKTRASKSETKSTKGEQKSSASSNKTKTDGKKLENGHSDVTDGARSNHVTRETSCDKEFSEQSQQQHGQKEGRSNARHFSDSTSEVSSDSGNGTSVQEHQSIPSPTANITCYQFAFPSRFCGKLVGKNGRNINQMKNASGCQITLLQHPFYNPDYQICTLDGTEDEISAALELIKEKYPTSKFSDITYEPFLVAPQEDVHPVISPGTMELQLISGIMNDVVVSSIVDASQLFVQQPAHPTFPSLESLNLSMNACYIQDPNAPTLPAPVDIGVICAAPLMGGWYRAQIVNWDETNAAEVDVKYVDYGGFARVPLPQLKQIRADFMTIPFQACECYMANIAPLEGEEAISVEAGAVLEELTQGCMLQCEIVQYDDVTQVPYIYLYKLNGHQTTFINRELVDRGVVRWIE